MSPFYLLDYNARIDFTPREEPRGVGVHPHRGFETVTIAYQGKVQHHDSRGNKGVISPGDIQWMTAGAGILHKEYHESEFSRKGGPFQVVQLWVNLPAKDKMTPPKYQTITNERIPKYILPEQAGVVEVIAGEYEGTKGAATTFTEIEMYNIRLNPGARIQFSLPEEYNTGILVIEGQVRVNDTDDAPEDYFVLFRNKGERISVSTASGGLLLVLSGKPLRESIMAYGPFLMNTKDEILQAFDDLNAGKFGELED
ncbi:MAG: pirin family protein, partial [Odoribacter splanchnicus]|nr:pirin family protein [Odoribacter splanchnicus]